MLLNLKTVLCFQILLVDVIVFVRPSCVKIENTRYFLFIEHITFI
jgi:hypothetical protein